MGYSADLLNGLLLARNDFVQELMGSREDLRDNFKGHPLQDGPFD